MYLLKNLFEKLTMCDKYLNKTISNSLMYDVCTTVTFLEYSVFVIYEYTSNAYSCDMCDQLTFFPLLTSRYLSH